ncbi:MAG TPA: protoporphyrinogen oxidase [Kiritimatiellia bacterium]|nr:protoporphyrinogen oxidase [Kiritimatiellia bacterium]
MTASPEPRIAIVGAGIAGLAAAHALRTAHPKWPVRIFDPNSRAGGKIVTDTEDGFVIEGGPDSFVTDKPWCLDLCRNLGLEHRLVPCNTAGQSVFILRNGKWVQFPGGLRLTIPTQFRPFLASSILPWSAKLRMLGDLVLPRGPATDDESLADFIRRRFGHECLEGLAGPMMAGIYVSDPQRMSMEATFPTFRTMERDHRSLILAAQRAKRKRKPGTNPPPMFQSLIGGMGELARTLQENLSHGFEPGSNVESITREPGGYTLEITRGTSTRREHATDILLAVPAWEAARLLRPLHAALADALEAIRYVSTATLSLAFAESDLPPHLPCRGFGGLIPPRENRRLIAMTWASTKFPGRAPEGYRLLRVFVGGPRHEADVDLDDQAMLSLVRSELRDLLGITHPPQHVRLYRWPRANPQYDVGHLLRVSRMEQQADSLPGIFLAGSAYRGIGMPDCIRDGQRAAQRLAGRYTF